MEEKIPDPKCGEDNETRELEQVDPYVGNRFFFQDGESENDVDDQFATEVATPAYEVACLKFT